MITNTSGPLLLNTEVLSWNFLLIDRMAHYIIARVDKDTYKKGPCVALQGIRIDSNAFDDEAGPDMVRKIERFFTQEKE